MQLHTPFCDACIYDVEAMIIACSFCHIIKLQCVIHFHFHFTRPGVYPLSTPHRTAGVICTILPLQNRFVDSHFLWIGEVDQSKIDCFACLWKAPFLSTVTRRLTRAIIAFASASPIPSPKALPLCLLIFFVRLLNPAVHTCVMIWHTDAPPLEKSTMTKR